MPFDRVASNTKASDAPNWRATRAPQTLLRSAVVNSTVRSNAVRQNNTQAETLEPDRPFHHPQTEITDALTELNITAVKEPFSPQSFKIGEIIKIPHMVQSFDEKANAAHRIQAPNFDGYICPKIRYAVVVGRYAHELLVLPIFSCNKQGVANKPDQYKVTAMSIYNPEDRSNAVRSLLLPDILCTQGGHKFYPGSHINLANMVSISYNWSIVPNQAQLKERDVELLKDRFRSVLKSAYMEAGAAGAFFKRELQISRAKLKAEDGSSRPPTATSQSTANSTIPVRTWALTAASTRPSRLARDQRPI